MLFLQICGQGRIETSFEVFRPQITSSLRIVPKMVSRPCSSSRVVRQSYFAVSEGTGHICFILCTDSMHSLPSNEGNKVYTSLQKWYYSFILGPAVFQGDKITPPWVPLPCRPAPQLCHWCHSGICSRKHNWITRIKYWTQTLVSCQPPSSFCRIRSLILDPNGLTWYHLEFDKLHIFDVMIYVPFFLLYGLSDGIPPPRAFPIRDQLYLHTLAPPVKGQPIKQ